MGAIVAVGYHLIIGGADDYGERRVRLAEVGAEVRSSYPLLFPLLVAELP
jgi:hypothetical protein